MSEEAPLELSALIQGLRAELAETWVEGHRDRIGFEAGPVEVEVVVTAERSAEARGGVKFWVVEAGAGGARSAGQTQRITLTLTPRDRRDPTRPLQIGGEAVEDER